MDPNEPPEYELSYQPRAAQDLDRILAYITLELSAPESALNLIDEIEHACESLRIFPSRAPKLRAPDLALYGYRMMTVGNFLIIFIIDEGSRIVRIERVVYSRRDLASALTNVTD